MKQKCPLIIVGVMAVFVVIGLGSASSSVVAAFEHESATANRSGQEMSGHANSPDAERRSKSHLSGNYFEGQSSGHGYQDGAGLNHGADLNHMDGAGDNPHYVYGGQPSSLGDPSVQELSRESVK